MGGGAQIHPGFTRLWPALGTVLLMRGSFWCPAQAVKGLPLGTNCAIWSGIGAVGTAIAGILLFKEPATVARLVCIVLIIGGHRRAETDAEDLMGGRRMVVQR